MTVLSLPMRPPVLVFGGPYSNLRALSAMRRVAENLRLPPQQVICTGDVVAYCVEPEETVAAIRDWGCHVVAGNCEEQLAAGAADCGCGFEEGSACDLLAKGWYPFAQARLSREQCAWMGELPSAITFRIGGRSFRVIHGGVHVTNRFVFASERDVLAEEYAQADADVVVAGHSGLPFISKMRNGAWFNPGVIGMPANDGTPDGCYGLIDVADGAIRLATRRLAYDYTPAAAAMRRFGHANGYARSLVTGLWPSLDILPAAERTATGRRLRPQALEIPAEPVALSQEKN
jgi:predicted phosphodiesterase